MYEKVNKYHPDKLSDRIAGALVDEACRLNSNCKIAVELILGHGVCHIIAETSEKLSKKFVSDTVHRICKDNNIYVLYDEHLQDPILASNQEEKTRCGDNGIFRCVPLTFEEISLASISDQISKLYPSDGKYILDGNRLIVCQSCCKTTDLKLFLEKEYPNFDIIVNPLGDWIGSINVDVGSVNRKLGSDMGSSITGGGLHGKDVSKSDVSINIYAFLAAQGLNEPVSASCAIGDEFVTFRIDSGKTWTKSYEEVTIFAKEYIKAVGGFEKFAEEGLIRKENP